MIVTCPNCETRFAVPQSALGTRGRTVRCARCGGKWHQTPESHLDDIPLESPAGASRRDTLADHLFETEDEGGHSSELAYQAAGNTAFDFGSTPGESHGESRVEEESAEDDPFARISELMMARPPESIPDVFSSPTPKPSPRRKGAAGLWLLLALLLLASLGAGGYFFQDRILDRWPEAARYYDELGLRNEVVGAGLAFRNYSSERLVQDNNEVLIVRGVIANTTEQPHEIPLLRLALYNNQALLQEKIISPPQTALEAKGTVGFRITLDQPDANASRFEVTFTAPKPPEAKP